VVLERSKCSVSVKKNPTIPEKKTKKKKMKTIKIKKKIIESLEEKVKIVK
jgi:hypothetical protein